MNLIIRDEYPEIVPVFSEEEQKYKCPQCGNTDICRGLHYDGICNKCHVQLNWSRVEVKHDERS
jgi:ribosomal protein L37AE/L43A